MMMTMKQSTLSILVCVAALVPMVSAMQEQFRVGEVYRLRSHEGLDSDITSNVSVGSFFIVIKNDPTDRGVEFRTWKGSQLVLCTSKNPGALMECSVHAPLYKKACQTFLKFLGEQKFKIGDTVEGVENQKHFKDYVGNVVGISIGEAGRFRKSGEGKISYIFKWQKPQKVQHKECEIPQEKWESLTSTEQLRSKQYYENLHKRLDLLVDIPHLEACHQFLNMLATQRERYKFGLGSWVKATSNGGEYFRNGECAKITGISIRDTKDKHFGKIRFLFDWRSINQTGHGEMWVLRKNTDVPRGKWSDLKKIEKQETITMLEKRTYRRRLAEKPMDRLLREIQRAERTAK